MQQSINIIRCCWAVKYQYGSNYHKDNSQRLSSLTESQTWIFSTRTESCHSANKSKKKGDVSLTRGSALWYKVGYNPNWIPTLIGYQTTEIDVCFLQWWSELSLFSHCWLPVVDPRRQLFPWIHRGRGQQRGYIQERIYGQDQRSAVGSTPYLLDLVQYPHCTHIVTIKV